MVFLSNPLLTIVQNMKQKIYHIIIFLLFWFCGVAYSQNPKADILQQDLSGLFDNLSMIGILGEDCSRIDIHIKGYQSYPIIRNLSV